MKTLRSKVPLFFSMLLLCFIFSCTNSKQVDKIKELTDTDTYYSALSYKKGMNSAFLAMFDSYGVMLSTNKMPVEGYKAIEKLLKNRNDSTFILSWKPTFTNVAVSGDLGYTYGIYQIRDKISVKIIEEGTYTTIWKKNKEGNWKAILDTGNVGLK